MFYCPDIASCVLPEEESQHCVQVLRAQAGDIIDVTDGVGQRYRCRVTNPHRKHCEFEVVATETPAPLHAGYIHLAIAPTKNIDRTEWMLEKCTEIGVDEVTLLLCEHSERRNINLERLQKIVVSAAKQSLRCTFPKLNGLTKPADLNMADADRFIAHCEEGYAASGNKHYLSELLEKGHNVLVLIGPEGDFSPAEIQAALQAGYKPVSLGNNRLRTETAGLVAVHTAVLANS